MKPKALMLLAVAIGCGLVAMLGVQQAMQGSQPKDKPVETRKVLVAVKDIRAGERLEDQNVVFKDVPVTALESFQGDVVEKLEDYEERSLTVSAVANDPIHKSKLSEKGVYSASSQIPKGMRIFTFPVSDAQTHSGMLRAGDRVDVTVAFTGRNGLMENKVLLELVKVFACENKTESSENAKDEQRARNVSLLVTPEQDGFIKIAQSRGQLALSLRHPDDDEMVNINGINSQALDDLKRSIGNDDMPGYGRQNYISEDDLEPVTPEPDPVEVVAPPVASTPAIPDNVQGFLQATAALPSPVAAVPEVKKYTMKIYQGNDLLSVEVDDDQPEPEAASTSGGIPGLLKSLWSTGQK